MIDRAHLTINGMEVPIEGERNLLEVIRKANIDIPTFCYHSELSVYGACRLCLSEVEGRGIVAACSTPPEAGMVVRTHTNQIRDIRRYTVELLLANHQGSCPTCAKSSNCDLQNLARRLGIEDVRFKPTSKQLPVDRSSFALVRDPNKCILCGDCVRYCSEIQGIGAIDFAHRGADAAVLPAFGKELSKVECVSCGQCARVCPTGALTPKSEIEAVWKALQDPTKKVIAQIAPAVRVAIGESFGLEAGSIPTGQIVAALRAMGFDAIYDTCFTADLTVFEEATEFIGRKTKGEKLPQFTSCCPAWVKFAEQYFPELLTHLSSCRSPQQMFGSLAKSILPKEMKIDRKDLVVVSIMPCTAKKEEAKLERFQKDGLPDVDHVLTTQELARMIEEAGLRFARLEPDSLDLPFGFKTGAGMLFGATGGVSEAVLRFAAEKLNGVKLDSCDFHAVRGQEGLRVATLTLGGTELKLAIVHGLANARRVAEEALKGESPYDLIEVMSCPGGCIGGAGQPIYRDAEIRGLRTKGIYNADKMLQLHKSQDNHYVQEVYKNFLGDVGGEQAHNLLHTHYHNRRRIIGDAISLVEGDGKSKINVSVCVGTNCHLRGSQDLLRNLIYFVEERGLQHQVDVSASFCFEQCDRGPTVMVGEDVLEHCTLQKAITILGKHLEEKTEAVR